MIRTVLIALALLAANATADAAELKKIKVTQAVASFSFLAADYARLAGYFKDEGLDVEQIATRGGGPDMAALISGDVDFNLGVGVYEINAAEAGRKLVNVFNIERRIMLGVVLSKAAAAKSGVKPDAPLAERAAALKGLKMGMTLPGSLTDRQIRHLMTIGGLKEGEVQIVSIGAPASLLAALERGQIDGLTISAPHDRLAVARGLGVMWVDNPAGDDPSVDPFLMSSLVTTADYAQKHPELVRAMVRALKRSVAELIAKPSAEIARVVQPAFSQVDPPTMLLSLDAMKKTLNPTGEVTLQMAENTVRFDGRGLSAAALMQTFDPSYLK
jgi:NitT/TauT family transport system substrate-binding protein